MADVKQPFVVTPGATRVDGAILPFKLSADDSDGALSICEFTLGGWDSGPVLHRHDAVDEGFYVVRGTLEAQLGAERVRASAGSFVWVPRGTPHTFANGGADTLHVVALASPGGIEALFAEQAAYFASLDGPPDLAVLSAMGERHGAPTLGPPIRAASAPGAPAPSGYGV
jgi:mannose-6-phosphate isomerase-like protein (cupin superfamily)